MALGEAVGGVVIGRSVYVMVACRGFRGPPFRHVGCGRRRWPIWDGTCLLSCGNRATGRDPLARGAERLPARAGGEDRGRGRATPNLVRTERSGSSQPCPS